MAEVSMGAGLERCAAQEKASAAMSIPRVGEGSGAAKLHFQQGQAHFAEGRFHLAAKEFEQAYALLPAAELLFNIGRAYEELGDYVAAIRLYEAYLNDADGSSDKSEVQSRVDGLRARLRAQDGSSDSGRPAVSLSLGSVPVVGEKGPRGDEIAQPTASVSRAYASASPAITSAARLEDPSFMPSPWFWGAVALSGASFVSAATFAALPRIGEDVSDAQVRHRNVAVGASLVAGAVMAVVSSVIYLVEQESSSADRP